MNGLQVGFILYLMVTAISYAYYAGKGGFKPEFSKNACIGYAILYTSIAGVVIIWP